MSSSVSTDAQIQNHRSELCRLFTKIKSVSLHNAEEMSDINNRKLGTCCEVRAQKESRV